MTYCHISTQTDRHTDALGKADARDMWREQRGAELYREWKWDDNAVQLAWERMDDSAKRMIASALNNKSGIALLLAFQNEEEAVKQELIEDMLDREEKEHERA